MPSATPPPGMIETPTSLLRPLAWILGATLALAGNGSLVDLFLTSSSWNSISGRQLKKLLNRYTYSPDQTPTTDLANILMRCQSLLKQLSEIWSNDPTVLHQPFILNDLLHLIRSSTCDRVAMPRLKMHEGARAFGQCINDSLADHQRADRLVACA